MDPFRSWFDKIQITCLPLCPAAIIPTLSEWAEFGFVVRFSEKQSLPSFLPSEFGGDDSHDFNFRRWHTDRPCMNCSVDEIGFSDATVWCCYRHYWGSMPVTGPKLLWNKVEKHCIQGSLVQARILLPLHMTDHSGRILISKHPLQIHHITFVHLNMIIAIWWIKE